MKNYKVKIKANNPEYKISEELENGVEADGVLCITFRNGEAYSAACYGVCIMDIAGAIAESKEDTGSIIRQAVVIANGLIEAQRIHEEDEKRNVARGLIKAMASMK